MHDGLLGRCGFGGWGGGGGGLMCSLSDVGLFLSLASAWQQCFQAAAGVDDVLGFRLEPNCVDFFFIVAGASHDDWRHVLWTLWCWGTGTAVTVGAMMKAGACYEQLLDAGMHGPSAVTFTPHPTPKPLSLNPTSCTQKPLNWPEQPQARRSLQASCGNGACAAWLLVCQAVADGER